MCEFVVMYCEHADRYARLHAFRRGDGSVRDENHVLDIVREFCKGNESSIVQRAPEDGERPLFEIVLRVAKTRHGVSSYSGWDFRRHEPCPFDVATWGMVIFRKIKSLLKKARARKEVVSREA